MKENNTLRKLVVVLFVMLALGTGAYVFIGGYDLWHAIFATSIILLSHFKHGTEDPVWEQLLTLILITGSYIAVAYLLRWAADYFLGGQFKENRRKRRMVKRVDKMEGHYIICGFGRVGMQVAEELFHENVNFVVIDRDQREVKSAIDKGYNAFCLDPTVEESLNKVGVCKAKGLISCLGEDTDNLFVTLSARSLNPDIYLVARANFEENIPKFEKAGANRVATPYQIGGYHMATMALRPGVLDFLDVIVDSRHDELEVEEIEIPRNSFLVGKSIAAAISRDKTGVSILAINKKDGSSKINPNGSEVIHANDKIIVMGNRDQLAKVADLIG
jgi:voltage-gated potassium channel